MQNKLQELTEKIYQEGLEKGNKEAKTIIDNAKQEATSIVNAAKKEAEQIIADANKKAEESKKNTKSEIKLSSKQAINALKQQVTDLISNKIVEKSTSKKFDADFTKSTIVNMLKNWSKEQVSDLSILLPEKEEKELTEFFNKSAKDLLNKGLEIKFKAAVKSGFQIAPKDGSYKISFTEEDFNNFFKQYLRPKLVEILFED